MNNTCDICDYEEKPFEYPDGEYIEWDGEIIYACVDCFKSLGGEWEYINKGPFGAFHRVRILRR